MANSFGIDTAGCNGIAYWDVAKAHGVHYAAARATISWGYQDKWFPNNWVGMKDQSIHRFAYHILYPSQPFKPQAENFLRVVGDQWNDAFPVNDFELDQGCGKSEITNCILGFNEYVSQRAPKVVNYSRKQWVDAYTELGEWRNWYDWWLGQYLNDRTIEDPRPPDLPIGVTSFLIHQNADHYPAWPGFTPGSLNLDTDRWNGDNVVCDQYFGVVVDPPEPPIVTKTQMRVLIENMNIRTAPNVAAPSVGHLHAGEILDILDVGGTESWIHHSRGWSAVYHAGTHFMEPK